MTSAPRNGTHAGHTALHNHLPEAFYFDEVRLKASDTVEKQELFLFQWLATLERELKAASEDTVKKGQPAIEKHLMRFISFPSPKPRRPIRRLIGQCFVLLYERGETRTLFDTLTALHTLINAAKNVEKESKLAAVVVVGAIMESVGHRMLSLFAETTLLFLKILKSSSTPQILRLETLDSFTSLLKGAGKAANESILKDLMKHIKASLTDKASIIRVASAQCMEACFKHTTQVMTAHDVEQLLSLLFKILENSNFAVRRAVASLCATILALTQTSSAKPLAKKTNTEPLSSSPVPDLESENVLMGVDDMLTQLSREYNRAVTGRELRAGVVEAYAALFSQLGIKYVERNYATILRHLMTELVSNPKNTVTEFDVATVREHVAYLLHDVIGKRLLSEQGQASAVRTLMVDWIKEWPALMPNQIAPSQYALVVTVNEVSALLWELGGAASSAQDVLVDPLVTLLSHPNFPVQIAVAWCLRCLCLSLPSHLSQLLPIVFGLLEKDTSNLTLPITNNDLLKRSVGYAHGIAAMMSVVPSRPLYISFDLSARAFSLANQLIKNPSKDIKIAAVQTQLAWILIGSLMCLGPNFVKLHLPNLLLLWKTTLPKPMVKDTNAIKSEVEWSFAFHTREAAITSIFSFLMHNARQLVNLDIAKRIVALLNNTLTFLTAAPSASFASATAPVLTSTIDVNTSCLPFAVTMADQNSQLRRRIFECFIAIRPANVYESLYPSLLRTSVSVFADPEKISQVLPTGPAAATYVSVWQAGDGYGYGVSSKIRGYLIDVAKNADDREDENNRTKDWMVKDRFRKVESQLEQAVLGSPDKDPLVVYTTFAAAPSTSSYQLPQPVSPLTSYIDASIELFAALFPLQSPLVQESILEQIVRLIKDPKLEKNSGRKMAIQVNVTIALLGAMKNVMASSSRKGDGLNSMIAGGRVAQMIQDLLQDGIIHPDQYMRFASSDAMGRLTSIVGSSLIANQIQHLVDQVVSNRDPDARAGSALALGSIYSHVGGMAAGSHLKTIVGILLSLCSDPHPVVYSWALDALATTVGSAGLTFSGYVSSTLSLVAKLYMAETHEPGGGSSATSNAGMAVGFSPYQEFGRIVYELIGTLGPELQSSSRTRELCLSIVEELKSEPDERVNVEAIRCIQNFIMFAPQHVDMSLLVPFLQSQLLSTHLPLKRAAVTCLYQLVQRDVKMVFKCARPGLNEELFALLDTDPQLHDVRNVIKSWLKQTAVENPSTWVNICKTVMSRTNSDDSGLGTTSLADDADADADADADYEGDEFDDDRPSIHTSPQAAGFDMSASVAVIPPRWRTQLFAMQCLHQAIEIIANSGVKEHFDLAVARKIYHDNRSDLLVLRVADLIRLGFSAATAPLNEMRLEGITLLRDVIERFASTEDPDFADSALLEQYAAQIGAALTPAFAVDSSSEIVSAAVKVCAIYVGSGIVKELDQLGRVLRLLTAALEKCKDESNVTALGEVRNISPHASVMVKLAVLNAWAELQVASTKQEYLIQVVEPNLPVLSPLWLSSLREYARVRLDSDIVSLASGAGMDGIQARTGGGFESMYSASTKDVILPFYKRSWLGIMGAVATLIEADDEYILRAVHEHESSGAHGGPSDLFYVLFGLCIETLSKVSSSGSGGSDKSPLVICLGALKTFMRPSLAGNMFLSKAVFLELMNVFDRLVQTEGPQIQIVIVETISRLVEDYGQDYICDDLGTDGEFNDFAAVDRALDPGDFPSTAKLYYLLRLLVTIFLQVVPVLSVRPLPPSARHLGPSMAGLLKVSLDALAALIAIGPPEYKTDLLAISFYVCTAILQDNNLQTELAPRVLANLKTVLENSEATLREKDIAGLARVVNATVGSLLIECKSMNDVDQNEIQTSKAKNAMLATVIIFSGCPAASLKAQGCLDKFVEVVQSALEANNVSMSLVALQCTRTLFLLSSKKLASPDAVELGRLMSKALCPLVVVYVLAVKTNGPTLLQGDPRMATVEEVIKSLVLLVGATDEPSKPMVLSALLPTLTYLLDDPPLETMTTLHELAVSRIVALATSIPQVFRETVAMLPIETRGKLQAAVRRNVAAQQQQQRQQEEQRLHEEENERLRREPTIQLNINFSNFA